MILTASNERSPFERDALAAMFEARKRIFVDLLKWDVPVLAGRFELDQFDDENATYIIVADEAGSHLASARLLKSIRPHILDSLFSDLVADDIPAGPVILEITRFCLDRRQNAAARLVSRNRLVTALVEHALASGIETYTGVADLSWLQQILAFGWRCRPLGLPRQIGGALLGALRIDIDAATPALLAQTGIWSPEPLVAAPEFEAA